MYYNIIEKLFSSISSNLMSDNLKKLVARDIENYADRIHNRLRVTKNLIFRNEPVDFYDNYIPLTLKSKSKNIRVSDPIQLLENYDKVGIIGSAGSGKTTLLRFIALSCMERGGKIPIVIELRNYNASSLSFEDFVASEISDENFHEVKKLFNEDKFIFIFDGYDEIDYVKGNSFINQIDRFVTKYSRNNFVISSRPGTNVESLLPFYIFTISPLNEDDIFLFIEKINIPSEVRKKLFYVIKEEYYFRDFLSIPLFLSLFILTFSSFGLEFPSKKSVFLRRIIDSLFSVHDSVSKLGYIRERLSNLDRDELEKISAILAFRTFFSMKFQLTKDELFQEFELIKKTSEFRFENENLLYDLTITVSVMVENGNYYLFPHILILEYLTATFISSLHELSKNDLYKKLLEKKSFKLSVSFYDFLYELDRNNFIKSYLVPALESFVQNPMGSDDDEFSKYNSFTLFDFLRNNSELMGTKLKNDRIYIYEYKNVLDKLKSEIKLNSDNNINPLLDILN